MEPNFTKEDYNVFPNNEIDSTAGISEDWMDTNCISFEEDSSNILSLNVDPLLSQAQIDENSILRPESFKSLKSLANTNVKNQNVLTIHNKNKKRRLDTEIKQTYKEDILKKYTVVELEVVHIRNGFGLVLRDSNQIQIFPTLLLKMVSLGPQPPIGCQSIKAIHFQEICDKTEIKIPQIISSDKIYYLCPVSDCTEAFMQPALTKQHVLKHINIKPYSCTYPNCLWKFFTQSHLQRHQLIHETRNSIECDYPNCKKKFSTVYNLTEHTKKTHLKQTNKSNKTCLVVGCNKSFDTVAELRAHFKVHSSSEGPYTCKIDSCKKRFFTKQALHVHSRAHGSENPTVCHFPNCGKSYTNKFRLKEHMRTHTGSRPFACQFEGCDWTFTTASRLKRHERVHSTEKNYVCVAEGCTKAFKRAEHLKEHTKIHSEALGTITCELCGLLYTTKVDHLKRFHTDLLREESLVITVIVENENAPQPPHDVSVDTSNANNYEYDVSNSCYEPVNKSEEDLLQEAIRSLGVPDNILEDEILSSDALGMLDNDDISTVNLKDLE